MQYQNIRNPGKAGNFIMVGQQSDGGPQLRPVFLPTF